MSRRLRAPSSTWRAFNRAAVPTSTPCEQFLSGCFANSAGAASQSKMKAKPMSENPTDRAARLRAEFERRFNESRDDLLDWLQDAVTEALVECETYTRREYSED